MTTDIRKLMEALDNLNRSPSQTLITEFDNELDALLQRTWQKAEDLTADSDPKDFVILESQLEEVLNSYATAHTNESIEEELSSEEFGQYRSDQEDHVRDFHIQGFDANLETLLSSAYEEAYRIGGEFRGPGIVQELYKIAKQAVLSHLGTGTRNK